MLSKASEIGWAAAGGITVYLMITFPVLFAGIVILSVMYWSISMRKGK